MGKYIYKITNQVNGKIYIGQSNNPKRRFVEHCNIRQAKKDNSLIGVAISKYGKENFTLDILGYFEDYNQKEKDYIKKYKSLSPNGYNLMPGGEEPPHYSGENNNFAKLTNERAERIIEAIQDYTIPRRLILKEYNITNDMFRHINEGDCWRDDNLKYPLRPQESVLNKIRADKVKKLLKETNLSQEEIAKEVKMKRSFVTMINCGKNYFDKNETYPIRETYKKRAFAIRKMLVETTLTQNEIACKMNVDYQIVNSISRGRTWRDNNLNYPLR